MSASWGEGHGARTPPWAGMAVGRQEASNQATEGWGRGAVTLWPPLPRVRPEEEMLSETHTRHLLKQQFPSLLKVIALQESLTNPVTERRPTGGPGVRPADKKSQDH